MPDALHNTKRLENGSFFAKLNGFDIHYEVHGTGPALMTLPNSWGLTIGGLRALYRPLEERLTLVYFDPRGMGESDSERTENDMGLEAVRADFEALRRHLGLERVHAIGWSNGAINLIFYASEYPQTLSSTIFVHGFLRFTNADQDALAERYPRLFEAWEVFDREMADESKPLEEKTARLKQFWVEEYFPCTTADPGRGVDLMRQTFRDAGFSWRHASYTMRAYPIFDARDRLPLITARSLVVAGSHDSLPPERSKEIHDGLADSSYALFEQSGHFSPVEEPEAFMKLIFEFIGVG